MILPVETGGVNDTSALRRAGMKRKLFLCIFLLIPAAGCNFPGPAGMQNSSSSVSRTPASGETHLAGSTQTRTATVLPTATVTYPPSDLPFTIDCSALPATRQADCDSFLAATRDLVYPIERELTGVNLSQCYKEIRYIILPDDPRPGAGGISAGDVITYNQRYSIDLKYRYDAHEILHSLSTCAHALDIHAFHGMIQNAVYERFGVHAPGYFEEQTSENLTVVLENLEAEAKKATGNELTNLCMGILQRRMTLAYFDLGEEAIRTLYQSTIPPVKNITPPDGPQTAIWGGYAPQVDALVETFDTKFKYRLGLDSCGYPDA
jgi:hypothetical protein